MARYGVHRAVLQGLQRHVHSILVVFRCRMRGRLWSSSCCPTRTTKTCSFYSCCLQVQDAWKVMEFIVLSYKDYKDTFILFLFSSGGGCMEGYGVHRAVLQGLQGHDHSILVVFRCRMHGRLWSSSCCPTRTTRTRSFYSCFLQVQDAWKVMAFIVLSYKDYNDTFIRFLLSSGEDAWKVMEFIMLSYKDYKDTFILFLLSSGGGCMEGYGVHRAVLQGLQGHVHSILVDFRWRMHGRLWSSSGCPTRTTMTHSLFSCCLQVEDAWHVTEFIVLSYKDYKDTFILFLLSSGGGCVEG